MARPRSAQRRQRTLDAVKRLLLRESQVQPLLVVFEDLHWIDAETQALLDGLVESLPLPVSCSCELSPRVPARAGAARPTTGSSGSTAPPESADELLEALLGADARARPAQAAPDRADGRQPVLPRGERADSGGDGGPGGRARRLPTRPARRISADPRHGAGDPGRAHRPAGARGQAAAPGGRRHRQGRALSAAPGHRRRAGARGARRADHLQAAEFLYETRLFPDLEYTFKHALTHEVAYGGLLHERRRALHARIVEAIERLLPSASPSRPSGSPITPCAGSCGRRRSPISARRGSGPWRAAAQSRGHCPPGAGARGPRAVSPRPGETTELTIDIRLDLRNALNPLGEWGAQGEHLHEAEALARTLGDQHRLARIATFMVEPVPGYWRL